MGIVGPNCENLTRHIEKRLGSVMNREHKPAYYQQVVEEEMVEEYTHDSEGC